MGNRESMFIETMGNSFILDILENSLLINIEQGMNIYHLLSQAILLKIPGDVVELGCYDGLTAALMQKTLDQYKCNKKLHIYDSFEGLPKKTKSDGNTTFQEGDFKTIKHALIHNFKILNLEIPEIHAGCFKDTLPTQLPEKICFAHLDGDFYSSIKESLEYIYTKLSKGAIVVIDDYCAPEIHKQIQHKLNSNQRNLHNRRVYKVEDILPGVKKACDKFFKHKKERVSVLIAGDERHGYFRKQ